MILSQRLSTTSAGLTLLTALALAGCNQNQGGTAAQSQPPLPLTTTSAPLAAPAPAPEALPEAPAAGIAYLDDPSEDYAYVDRAEELAGVLGDAPPDYGFDYDGTEPWVWSGDGFLRVVEQTPDGERYYYYDAGSSYPYLIQDGGYGYAYSGPDLVMVYGPDGRVLPPADARARAALAGRYLARARVLHDAALGGQRQAVAVGAWQARRQAFQAEHDRQASEQARIAGWNGYHQAHDAEDQVYWRGEQNRRQAEAQAYGQVLGGAHPRGPLPGPTPTPDVLAKAASAYGAAPHAGAPRRPPPHTREGGPAAAPTAPGPQPRPQQGLPPEARHAPPQIAPSGAEHVPAAPPPGVEPRRVERHEGAGAPAPTAPAAVRSSAPAPRAPEGRAPAPAQSAAPHAHAPAVRPAPPPAAAHPAPHPPGQPPHPGGGARHEEPKKD